MFDQIIPKLAHIIMNAGERGDRSVLFVPVLEANE